MRCGVHGLAAGPDGSCALCRRGESARPSKKRLSPLGAALGLIAVLCVSAIGYTALRRAMTPAEPAVTAESSTPSEEPPAGEPDPEVAEKPEAAEQPEVAEAPAYERPQPAPEPTAAGDEAAALDTRVAATSPAPNPSVPATSVPAATATAAPASRIAAPEQLRSAMQRVPVTMYTTAWCKHCERARAFMRRNSIPFVEHDVEASDSAKQAQKRLNPAGGVPTIDIDGQVLVGFNEASALHALVAAAQRRMR
jgi:glutaredoxin